MLQRVSTHSQFGAVYRDLKSDNIALYQVDSCLVHAVIIDFGKCLHVSSCTTYSLTDSECRTYHKSHRHIPPYVVDGASKPSTASDIYSLGRIVKHTIHYGSVELKLWPKSVIDVCKQCLSHLPSARPGISEIIHVLKQCC